MFESRRPKLHNSAAKVFTGVIANHSFFSTTEGSVYALGVNEYGQLGLGDDDPRSRPERMPLFAAEGRYLDKAACGLCHSLFLLEDGDVYSCGSNIQGQLGHGDTRNRFLPVKVASLCGVGVIDVKCGQISSYCLDKDGRVYSFGHNINGQLGDGTNVERPSPAVIAISKSKKIVDISAGYYHAAAMTEDGDILLWGADSSGDLDATRNILSPELVSGLPDPAERRPLQVICGGFHTNVVYSRNCIYYFGGNTGGQLGAGHADPIYHPVRMKCFDSISVLKLVNGGGHTIYMTQSGGLMVLGFNSSNQVCAGSLESLYVPKKLHGLRLGRIVDVMCGWMHTILVTSNGACYGIGNGESFGRAFDDDLRTPEKLLDRVQLGDDQVSTDIYRYIVLEQQTSERSFMTTDLDLFITLNGKKDVIRVNKALFTARCSDKNIFSRNAPPKVSKELKGEILRCLYTNNVKNRRLAPLVRKMLGIRNISIYEVMARLYAVKSSDGDVMITSRGGTVHWAHKFVLVARTTYFRSLFRGEWREAQKNEIELEMRLGDSFEYYLQFLYTGAREESDKSVQQRFFEYCDYFGDGSD